MKRYTVLIAVMAAGMLLFSSCGDAGDNPAQTSPAETASEMTDMRGEETGTESRGATEDYKRIARSYMERLKNSDYDKLKTEFSYDSAMKNIVDAGQLESSLKQIFIAVGEIEEIGNPFVVSEGTAMIIGVPCKLKNGNLNFNFTFSGEGKIAGILTAEYEEQNDSEVISMPDSIEETELPLSIDNGWMLPGTLTVPKGKDNYPVVVLVHGSGAQNRDESIGQNAPFRDLAWGLAEKGIAVYRYDKRSFIYGKEAAADVNFTVNDETVNDAAAAAEMLKGVSGVDAERVYVLGHSLGGEMIPRIAQKVDAAGYVMMAAPARDLISSMTEQIEFLSGLSGMTEQEKEALQQQKEAVGQLQKQLEDLDSLDPTTPMMGGTYPAYWSDLLSYDPLKEAEGIGKPVLVLQGEEDYQVTLETDYQSWIDKFGSVSGWSFQTYPGLTHLFMEGKRENGSGDYMKVQTVNEQVIEDIAQFIEVQ